MPVINPKMQMIPASEMAKFGAEIIITNAYIIYRNPELRDRARAQGVHSLLGFDGAIMTDSGSYQLSEYHDIEVTSDEIVGFQQTIASDIGVPLDIPTPPDVSRERAESEIATTIKRCEAAHQLHEYERDSSHQMLLAGTVQGSTHPDLRYRCARALSEIGFDLYNKLLEEAVAELKGEEIKRLPETRLKIP